MEEAKALAKLKNKMEAEVSEIRMEKWKELATKLLKNEDNMLTNFTVATVAIAVCAGVGFKTTAAGIRLFEAYIAKPKLGKLHHLHIQSLELAFQFKKQVV